MERFALFVGGIFLAVGPFVFLFGSFAGHEPFIHVWRAAIAHVTGFDRLYLYAELWGVELGLCPLVGLMCLYKAIHDHSNRRRRK